MGVLNMTTEFVPMIIPTVMIPLTLVSVGISVVASFIAGLFGIKLKMEGPKKLLEVLLKPRVLATAFLLNAVIMGGIYLNKYWKNYPRLLSTIEKEMAVRSKVSDISYEDVPTNQAFFKSIKASAQAPDGIDQVWRVDTGSGSFRPAIASTGRIFSGNKEGIISEIDLATGEVVRTFYTGTMVSPRLTLWKNQLYAGEGTHDTHHARVYRFDLKEGKLKNSFQTKGHTEGQAIVGTFENEETLFIVSGSDGLHAVDPMTLAVKWEANPGHMDAAVVVDEMGYVFLGTGREKGDDSKNKTYAAALEFKTGKELWKHELPASSWMRPVLAGNHICYITGEIYFPSERGHIVCFDRQSGEPTAGIHTLQPLASTPKVVDSSIIYTSIKGLVCRFEITTRRNLWCFDAGTKGISFAGASYDERLHVVLYPSVDKGLYVLDTNNGNVLMNWNPSEAEGPWKKTYSDVSVVGDLWIVADYDRSIRALRPKFLPRTANNK